MRRDDGPVRWKAPDGSVISCVEKLKVLGENVEEIHAICQDALDDAVLIGCDPAQFLRELQDLVARLESDFQPLPSAESSEKPAPR
jgi:hypothetical protein